MDWLNLKRRLIPKPGLWRSHWRSLIFPGVIILFLVACLVGFFVLNRMQPHDGSGVDEGGIPLTTFDALLQTGSSTALFDHVKNLEPATDFPSRLANLKKQLVIGDRIIELESASNSSLLQTAELMKVDTVMELNRLHENYGLDLEFVNEQVERHVLPAISSSSREVVEAASLCANVARYQQYLESRTDGDYQAMRDQFMDSVKLMIESEQGIRRLVKVLIKFDSAENNRERDHNILREMGELILASPNETIQLIAADMLDESYISMQDLRRMTLGISLVDADSIQKGLEFIETVANEDHFGSRSYTLAILVAEQLERTKDGPRLQAAIASLVDSVSEVSKPSSKKRIEKIVGDFVKRHHLSGKRFVLAISPPLEDGTDLPAESDGKWVAVLFYDDSEESTLALDSLGSCSQLILADADVLCLAVELANPGKPGVEGQEPAQKELLRKYSLIVHLDPERSKSFLTQCPVQKGPFPYLILIGKDSHVLQSNVNPEDLRVLLENPYASRK